MLCHLSYATTSLHYSNMEVQDKLLIYNNTAAGVSVYRGRLDGLTVAVKEQLTHSLQRANEAISESLNQAQLDHPNVCRVYKCFLDPQVHSGFKSVIIMEWMERDVFTIIRERQTHQQFWSEEELWRYLAELIEALAYAQSKGIAHRDIKPQNIFLNAAGLIKVGDFGASKWQLLDVNQQSIQGTPFFLSPALRRHYRTFIATGQARVLHNQYKSDVYSLGFTFLFMAFLAEPKELLTLEGLEVATELKLTELKYSDRLKGLLRAMLIVSEEQRPDFLELARSLSLKQRTGLTAFRQDLGMASDDVSMKSSMQTESLPRCPVCSSVLSLPTALCSSCSPPSDCVTCSKRFQLDKESWRDRLSSEKQVNLDSACSEACALHFLQLIGEESCAFCRAAVSQRVPLPCDHCFCSPSCLLLYLMRCTCCYTVPTVLRCPTCLTSLPGSLSSQVFGTELNTLVQKYRQEHCVECSCTIEAGRLLACGYHSLCTNCKTLRTNCRFCQVNE